MSGGNNFAFTPVSLEETAGATERHRLNTTANSSGRGSGGAAPPRCRHCRSSLVPPHPAPRGRALLGRWRGITTSGPFLAAAVQLRALLRAAGVLQVRAQLAGAGVARQRPQRDILQ